MGNLHNDYKRHRFDYLAYPSYGYSYYASSAPQNSAYHPQVISQVVAQSQIIQQPVVQPIVY
jgi:hypothetical protein